MFAALRHYATIMLPMRKRSNSFPPAGEKGDSYSMFKRTYRLGQEIGRGGFGVVYGGHRIDSGAPVAIKYVVRENVTDWSTLDGHNVPLEIALLWHCRHIEGVIKLLDWYERCDGFLIVMERPCPAKDLFDFISERGSLDEHMARMLFIQCVRITLECAKSGVVHRDIKDENFIVDMNTGNLKLIDFGSGAFLRESAFTDYKGTRVCAPPEWIIQGRYHGLPLTVWSLGILLYAMVCGNIPYVRDMDIINNKLHWRKHVSLELRNLVKSCLASNASNRPTLEEIAAHPWMNPPERKSISLPTFLGEDEETISPRDGVKVTISSLDSGIGSAGSVVSGHGLMTARASLDEGIYSGDGDFDYIDTSVNNTVMMSVQASSCTELCMR